MVGRTFFSCCRKLLRCTRVYKMAKRIASSSVDWNFLNKHVFPFAKPYLMQLKNKSDKYFKKVSELPAELPKIDWKSYQNKISKAGMLETFQKNYETVKIPYPDDGGLLASVDQSNTKHKETYKKEMEEINQKLIKAEEILKKLTSEKKFSEMTKDELYYKYPHIWDFDNDMYPVGWASTETEGAKKVHEDVKV